MSIRVNQSLSLEQLQLKMAEHFANSPYVVLSDEQLISIDFEQRDESAVIDTRWTNVLSDNMVKIVLWYDNEWGYSCRVTDLARRITSLSV